MRVWKSEIILTFIIIITLKIGLSCQKSIKIHIFQKEQFDRVKVYLLNAIQWNIYEENNDDS